MSHDTNDQSTQVTINAIRNAVQARKDSIAALRERIWALLEPLPVGVRLYDDNDPDWCPLCGETHASGDGTPGYSCETTPVRRREILRIVRAEASGYQSGWPTAGMRLSGNAAITPDHKIIAYDDDLDSDHNGSNIHYRRGEIRARGRDYNDYDTQEYRFLAAAETRRLALRLPAAIARYMEQCEQERAANDSTLV